MYSWNRTASYQIQIQSKITSPHTTLGTRHGYLTYTSLHVRYMSGTVNNCALLAVFCSFHLPFQVEIATFSWEVVSEVLMIDWRSDGYCEPTKDSVNGIGDSEISTIIKVKTMWVEITLLYVYLLLHLYDLLFVFQNNLNMHFIISYYWNWIIKHMNCINECVVGITHLPTNWKICIFT